MIGKSDTVVTLYDYTVKKCSKFRNNAVLLRSRMVRFFHILFTYLKVMKCRENVNGKIAVRFIDAVVVTAADYEDDDRKWSANIAIALSGLRPVNMNDPLDKVMSSITSDYAHDDSMCDFELFFHMEQELEDDNQL